MRKKLLRSRSGFEKPESREEAIMQNILGASNVLEPSESNIEEILKSILYNTPYTKEAEFEIEKILLAIKNNGTYDCEGESRDMNILIAILNDLDYTEEAESRIEELFIRDIEVGGIDNFKTFLAQQYANGTPVCVWYVLATPQTAVVNEPLRKIGNYTDSISMEQAGVQIPTNNGTTVIDVDTTLKPSNIYIEYK